MVNAFMKNFKTGAFSNSVDPDETPQTIFLVQMCAQMRFCVYGSYAHEYYSINSLPASDIHCLPLQTVWTQIWTDRTLAELIQKCLTL